MPRLPASRHFDFAGVLVSIILGRYNINRDLELLGIKLVMNYVVAPYRDDCWDLGMFDKELICFTCYISKVQRHLQFEYEYH